MLARMLPIPVLHPLAYPDPDKVLTKKLELKWVRHQLDIPVCWILGDYPKVSG